jgi:hypothetical protein
MVWIYLFSVIRWARSVSFIHPSSQRASAMNDRVCFLAVLAVCVALGTAATAAAVDPSPSHQPLPGQASSPREAEDLLQKRLGRAKDMKFYNEAAEQLLKNSKIENLSRQQLDALKELGALNDAVKKVDVNDPKYDKLKKQLNDPKYAKLKEQLHDLKLDPLNPKDLSTADVEALEKLRDLKQRNQQNPEAPVDLTDANVTKFMDKLLNEQAKNHSGNAKDNGELLSNVLNHLGKLSQPDAKVGTEVPAKAPIGQIPAPGTTVPAEGPPSGNGPATAPPPAPQVSPPTSPPAPSTPSPPNWLSKWVINAADKATDGDDDAKSWLAETIKGLAVTSTSQNMEGSDLASSWSKLSEFFPSDKMSDAGSSVAKMKMPSLPDVGPAAAAAPKLSGVGGSADGASGIGNVVIALLVVVAAGVVAWVLLSKYKIAQLAQGADAWKLGAWPVHPSMVRTRADIVKAFEYLAVLVLGAAARTQHHLELAEELGHQAPTNDVRRTEAARALARLYEIARYTPETETLPADDLAAARRELSFLAGAAAA